VKRLRTLRVSLSTQELSPYPYNSFYHLCYIRFPKLTRFRPFPLAYWPPPLGSNKFASPNQCSCPTRLNTAIYNYLHLVSEPQHGHLLEPRRRQCVHRRVGGLDLARAREYPFGVLVDWCIVWFTTTACIVWHPLLHIECTPYLSRSRTSRLKGLWGRPPRAVIQAQHYATPGLLEPPCLRTCLPIFHPSGVACRGAFDDHSSFTRSYYHFV
jgi:hypothetical protein